MRLYRFLLPLLFLLTLASRGQAQVVWTADPVVTASSLAQGAAGTFNLGGVNNVATGLIDENTNTWAVVPSGFVTALSLSSNGAGFPASTTLNTATFSGGGGTSNATATFSTDASGAVLPASIVLTSTGGGFTTNPTTVAYKNSGATVITATTQPVWAFGLYTGNVIHDANAVTSKYTSQLDRASSATSLNQRIVYNFIMVNAASQVDADFRINNSGRGGVGVQNYLVDIGGTNVSPYYVTNSVPTSLGSLTTALIPVGHMAQFDGNTQGSTPSTVVGTLYDLGPASALTAPVSLGTVTSSANSSTGVQSAGQIGISQSGTNNATRTYIVSIQTYQGGGTGVSMGTLTSASSGANVLLSWAAATGGVAPYAYAVYRSTSSNYTPGAGTLLASSATSPYTDAPPSANVTYYYQVVVADSTSGTPLTSTSNEVAGVATAATPMKVYFYSDSRVAGTGVTSLLDTTNFPAASKGVSLVLQAGLNAIGGKGLNNITVYNEGVSGITAAYWTSANIANSFTTANSGSGATAVPGSPGTNDVALLAVGTNDSKNPATSDATYITNVTATLNALISNGFSRIVVTTEFPTTSTGSGAGSWDLSSPSAIQGYNADLPAAIAACTSPARVTFFDPGTYNFFSARMGSLYYDSAHLNDKGYSAWASLLLPGVALALGLTPTAIVPNRQTPRSGGR